MSPRHGRVAVRSLNLRVLSVFAPVLVVAGVLGCVLPPEANLTSGATPYNVFHIAFGAIGGAIALAGREAWIRRFDVGFGAIDLYQAVASFAGWFPADLFLWRRADDVLHVAIGGTFVTIGLVGRARRATGPASPR